MPLNVSAEAKRRLIHLLYALPRRDLRELYDLLISLYCPSDLSAVYSDAFWHSTRQLPTEYFAGPPSGKTLTDRVLSMQFQKWLPANINLKQDKLCMAHSVENRVPFLDHSFVEFAGSLPSTMKLNRKGSKYVLRRWASTRLPAAISAGKKNPFHLPLERYLRDPRLWDLVEENTTPTRIKRRGFLRSDYVSHLKQHAHSGNYLLAKRLFSIVIFELWCRTFLDAENIGSTSSKAA